MAPAAPESAVARFQALTVRRCGRQPTKDPGVTLMEQDECFQLAQAICGQQRPDLQQALDGARRELMRLASAHEAVTGAIVWWSGHEAVVTPHRKHHAREKWTDHQVSPEFSRNPGMTGLRVPKELTQRLLRLHREQVAVVTALTRWASRPDSRTPDSAASHRC